MGSSFSIGSPVNAIRFFSALSAVRVLPARTFFPFSMASPSVTVISFTPRR